MIGPTEGTHVEYAVQVQLSGDKSAEWYHRYGWFPETDSVDGRKGLDRAKENIKYALNDFPVARIVRRTYTLEVVEWRDPEDGV